MRIHNIGIIPIHVQWWYVMENLFVPFFSLFLSYTNTNTHRHTHTLDVFIGSNSNFLFARSNVMMINDELWLNEITKIRSIQQIKKKKNSISQRHNMMSTPYTPPQIAENCLFLTFNYRNFSILVSSFSLTRRQSSAAHSINLVRSGVEWTATLWSFNLPALLPDQKKKKNSQ